MAVTKGVGDAIRAHLEARFNALGDEYTRDDAMREVLQLFPDYRPNSAASFHAGYYGRARREWKQRNESGVLLSAAAPIEVNSLTELVDLAHDPKLDSTFEELAEAELDMTRREHQVASVPGPDTPELDRDRCPQRLELTGRGMSFVALDRDDGGWDVELTIHGAGPTETRELMARAIKHIDEDLVS